jgi:hypothetical protein
MHFAYASACPRSADEAESLLEDEPQPAASKQRPAVAAARAASLTNRRRARTSVVIRRFTPSEPSSAHDAGASWKEAGSGLEQRCQSLAGHECLQAQAARAGG